jgi:hypothetical protein
MADDTKDPSGIGQHEMGAKLDDGKAPLFKGVFNYFPKAMRAIAQLSATGARKYTWGGWSAVEDAEERYLDADARHLADFGDPDEDDMDLTYYDEEEGIKYYHHHLVAHLWNAAAALEKAIERGITTEYTRDAPRKTNNKV